MPDKTTDAMARALRQMTTRYEALVKAFSILTQIDQLDGAHMDLGEASTSLLSLVNRELLAENCSIMLLDARTGRLSIYAAASPVESRSYFLGPELWTGKTFALGEGVAGRAAQTGEPVRVEDTEQCDFFVKIDGPTQAPRALLSLPLILDHGTTLGVLNLSHSRPGFFTVETERAMVLVARRCANVLAPPLLLYRAGEGALPPRMPAPVADALAVFAPDGQIMGATDSLEAVTGFAPGHWCAGGGWEQQVHDEDRDRFRAHRQAVFEGGQRARLQYRFHRGDGREIRIAEAAAPLNCERTGTTNLVAALREAEGVPLGAVEQIHAEAQLMREQRIRALGRLAENVASALGEQLERIVRQLEGADGMGEAREAARQADGLARQLRSYRIDDTPDIAEVDVTALLEEAALGLRGAYGPEIEMQVACPGGPAMAQADESRLQLAITNLCINAHEALAEAGTCGRPKGKIVLGVEPGGPGKLRVFVRDNGPGIGRDAMDRLFEPFFTTKPAGHGAGLGLTIAHNILRQHGSDMEVRSEVGRGATFSFVLDRTEGSPEPLSNAAPGEPAILLVDDDAAVLRVGVAIVKRLGYAAVTAEDGGTALRLWSDPGTRVDLIICDEGLPDMEGHDLIRRIREASPGAKAILSSGQEREDIEALADLAPEHQPNDFLPKPYRIGEMAEVIKQLLEG